MRAALRRSQGKAGHRWGQRVRRDPDLIWGWESARNLCRSLNRRRCSVEIARGKVESQEARKNGANNGLLKRGDFRGQNEERKGKKARGRDEKPP